MNNLERKYPGIFEIVRSKPTRDVKRGLAWLSAPGNRLDWSAYQLDYYNLDGL